MPQRGLLVALLGLCFGGSLAVVACQGDDTNGQSPADAAVLDSTTGADSSLNDASSAPDMGSADTGASRDAADAQAEAAVDASDAGACVPVEASIDALTVEAGSALASQYKCTDCHGSGLTGNNDSIIDSGSVYPPNLTPDPTTGIGCWSDDEIARAILDGIDDQDADLCKMPHFRAKFVEAGVDPTTAAGQIVQFLRSLRPTDHTVPDTICPVTDAGPGDAGASDAGGG